MAAMPMDFRTRAFRDALGAYRPRGNRAKRVQMIFSDPTTEPREKLDRKAAYGAYNPALEVRPMKYIEPMPTWCPAPRMITSRWR